MFPSADAALQRRLDPRSDSPIAVAVSGGGDSLAALIATAEWARKAGRKVVALCVDHGLQPQSAEWTRSAGRAATRLGASFHALAWTADKPATGLPAAARAARHCLLVTAARQAGARVIVMGHTADDMRENALMGQGALCDWAPSPVWPEGRGVFVLRPLLGLARLEIRQALAERGEPWIDDPANDDERHPRVRARRSLEEPTVLKPAPPVARLAGALRYAEGVFHIDRSALAAAPPAAARRLLAAAMVCAGGGDRLPRKAQVDGLIERLQGLGEVHATLAGARLLASAAIAIGRDAGETRSRRLGPMNLRAGETAVWDGRYEIEARSDLTIAPLKGQAKRLDPDERRHLLATPGPLRPACPIVTPAQGLSPSLRPPPAIARLSDLVHSRFLAACDAIAQESELAQGAHSATQTGVLCSTLVTK